MASRRAPLANLSNAVNSPYREQVGQGNKRLRGDAAYDKLPPAKRQIIETEDAENRRQIVSRKTAATQATTTTRRTGERAAKVGQKVARENLEDIRQWQRHYKKLFPQMTFYYDAVPDETRHKISRQIQQLGSREEVFFSKSVTHVVTTRSVPSEISTSSSSVQSPSKPGRDGTINPSHLKKALPLPLHPNDVLVRAKAMGMKVWTLEKLQRMLHTMFNNETGEAPVAAYSRNTAAQQTKAGQQAHLGQMLAKEKEYNQVSMDWATDMAQFRGYYIYVHDMDELTKPAIVRDYSKPQNKELGKWPQLRVTAPGRCPFLDDPNAKVDRAAAAAPEKAPRTRAAVAREQTPAAEGKALADNANLAQRRQRATSAQPTDRSIASMDPPKTIPAKRGSTDNLPLFGSAQASLRRHPRFAGGEPIASGVQPSNITSAIKSQMISSTAAAPGGRAGATKELTRLQRQVLERNTPNPYLNNDLRAAINGGGRGQKRKAQDNLANIREEDDAGVAPRLARSQVALPARKKKIVEKELKPGYCENCREKFEDFDQHIESRKHRKFALDDGNWTQLDDLLDKLDRPMKLPDIDELEFDF